MALQKEVCLYGLQGPLQQMGELELGHWMNVAAARTALSATHASGGCLDKFTAGSRQHTAKVEV